MLSRTETLTRLTDSGVVAVIRAQSDSQLLDIAQALLDGGVAGIEVTMTTPNALRGIEKLAAAFASKPHGLVIGVGTILDPATCAAAIHAGADFVVSPVLIPAVIETTRKLGKVSIPGAFTPTEILAAWTAGADIVKVFPATALGASYFKDLLAPMPFLKLTPTGGVDLKTIPDFIKAGAVCVGAGSALVSKKDLAESNWKNITQTATAFTQAVRQARAK